MEHRERPFEMRGSKAGRNPSDLDIAGCAWISISNEVGAADQILRSMVAYFGPYLEEHALATIGLTPAEFLPLKEKVDTDDLTAATQATTDRMLDLAIRGNPDDVIKRIDALANTGITQINLGGPLGPDPEEAIRLLGRRALPHFRANAT
jgi:5,10-methylenetetrahydromethanopterin reductase